MSDAQPCVVIDRTHLGRRASGLERITRDLFSEESLAPLPVRGTAQGGSRLATLMRQLVLNPLDAVLASNELWVFSGFPPSPAFGAFVADRTVLYVHDMFLIERKADLNRAARFYMAPSFRAALRHLRWFLANSATTADRLAPHIGPCARVQLYRPEARDVLNLRGLPPRTSADQTIRIGMIGTIEPRKNYPGAVAVRNALETMLGRPVELNVVGRAGWGADAAALAHAPGVRLHGFVADADMAACVSEWDLLLSTSHDEGLGLPLLEVQQGGLPVVAPNSAVFREVLGESGTYIDTARPDCAAAKISVLLEGGRDRAATAAYRNIERWNRLAAKDHAAVIEFLATRLAALGGARAFA